MNVKSALAAALLVVSLTACGGAAATATPASTAAEPAAAASTTGGTTAAAGKVSANSATRAQVQAALEAAGVPQAARMAGEVEEYRPYPAGAEGEAKLRKELAKYNIAADVVDKIIATLTF